MALREIPKMSLKNTKELTRWPFKTVNTKWRNITSKIKRQKAKWWTEEAFEK